MARSSRELLDEARRVVPEVTAERARDQRGRRFIDVREQDEWDQGHIPGAVHLSKGYLEIRIEDVAPDRSAPLTLYCAAGVRSLLAAKALRDMGYEDVESLAGG